jgi:UDPglucose--hexose-1-phosphate uridylyltransferase
MPGWLVRVVPNLYPAFTRQEVVVHTPRHARSLAALDEHELELVAEAWRRRREAEPDGYLHALVNEGRIAGASLPHSHSQLIWLEERPPEVEAERGTPSGHVVRERDGLVALCPWASRVPYEVAIVPERDEADAFASPLLAPALRLLGETIGRLHALRGPVPLNAWLHNGTAWHLELFPRVTVLAGLEFGAGIYVNAVPPEEAAQALREAIS